MNDGAAGISRLLDRYRGIEDFYFLNRDGELGYIRRQGLRSLKETFPQVNRQEFLRRHPGFILALEYFLRDLIELAIRCDSPYADELELGYVLPAGDGQRWRSATLVLHDRIIDQIRDDAREAAPGRPDSEASTTASGGKLRRFRSVQRGFDDLIHHRDAAGHGRYFPALFYRSGAAPVSQPVREGMDSRLRVVNLKWRPAEDTATIVRDSGAREDVKQDYDVYALLRSNLMSRGAIDRTLRLEHRLRELSLASTALVGMG